MINYCNAVSAWDHEWQNHDYNDLNVHLVVNSNINICLQLGVEKTRRFILANE